MMKGGEPTSDDLAVTSSRRPRRRLAEGACGCWVSAGYASYGGRSGQYNLQSRTKHVPGKPPLRSASMDSLDDLTLDDYWTELEHIQSSNNDQEQHNDLVEKVPDEGELEEEWLKEAGLSDLLVDSADPIESKVLLSTLTRTQAAAVQKRIEMVTQTLRKKNKQQQIPDVRSIFGLPPSQAEKQDGGGTCQGCPECFRFKGQHFRHTRKCCQKDVISHLEHIQVGIKGAAFLQSGSFSREWEQDEAEEKK
ncbi:RHG18 protein, partial [Polypterus senegalus]